MTDNLKAVGQTAAKQAPDKPKQLSGTGYPYYNLEDSSAVAEVIHSRGGGSCDLDQLAAWLGYKSTSSGTFASRLSSARYFGLIGPTKGGVVAVTERARAILAPVMPNDAVNGRQEAFLAVPLYRAVFHHFKGTTLPPLPGLANFFQQKFKILPDRSEQAVRVFKESATQAGFFNSAPDRLIRPAGASAAATVSGDSTSIAASERKPEAPAPERRARGGGGDDGYGVDPSILGLLRRLPQPGQGWSSQDQESFINAFVGVVKFLYPAKGEAGDA